jgi:hypothetical protein
MAVLGVGLGCGLGVEISRVGLLSSCLTNPPAPEAFRDGESLTSTSPPAPLPSVSVPSPLTPRPRPLRATACFSSTHRQTLDAEPHPTSSPECSPALLLDPRGLRIRPAAAPLRTYRCISVHWLLLTSASMMLRLSSSLATSGACTSIGPSLEGIEFKAFSRDRLWEELQIKPDAGVTGDGGCVCVCAEEPARQEEGRGSTQ